MSAPLTKPEKDALLDALLDLQHDLGKYLCLPVAMLPSDASPADVAAALEKALHRTRTTAAGTRSARDLWGRFLADVGDGSGLALGPLRGAVDAALAWEAALAAGRRLPARDVVLAELERVGQEARRLIAEVRDA